MKATALEQPTQATLENWLSLPRVAKNGIRFTPSEPMWWPDRMVRNGVNWQSAVLSVSSEWRRWLQAALAYRMAETAQGTVGQVASILSRSAQAGLDPLNEQHVIDIRNRFNVGEFSSLVGFIEYWHNCNFLEKRPSLELLDIYKTIPRKKRTTKDVILSLDPEEGPFTQAEQNALYQWMHDQFCHGNLEPEYYLYLRLALVYGLRGVQLRALVFKDFVKKEQGCKIRLYWAKQRGQNAGWREKFETFHLDSDLYKIIEKYKLLVLSRLNEQYPSGIDWNKAIDNVPLFRRKRRSKGGDQKRIPEIIDLPVLKKLEKEPQNQLHASDGSIRAWLFRMEEMPGFPISSRTGKPLKISRGHRFRHTLGTDLSNAGLDEWSIASALMHTRTDTVRKYRAISAELMDLIDSKMSDHLALVVGAFTGTIVTDRSSAKNGNLVDRQIEDLAVCGSDIVCNLDAPFSCYACSKFQPLLDADHTFALERLERRREQTIMLDKTTGALWDRAILACRKIILDCNALRDQKART